MSLYRIKDWDEIYENNRSRTVKDLAWVPIPNRHDGEAYSRLMVQKDAAIHFSVWILLLQVASRCHPRGSLLTSSGLAHNPETLSIKTRAKQEWFEKSIPFLVQIGWLESERQEGVSVLSAYCQAGDTQVSKKEGNGIEQKEGKECFDVEKDILMYLNQVTGKNFQAVKANLQLVRSRLAEGYTPETLKGIADVKCSQWLHKPEYSVYLRPETLFGAKKCASYAGEVGAKTPQDLKAINGF